MQFKELFIIVNSTEKIQSQISSKSLEEITHLLNMRIAYDIELLRAMNCKEYRRAYELYTVYHVRRSRNMCDIIEEFKFNPTTNKLELVIPKDHNQPDITTIEEPTQVTQQSEFEKISSIANKLIEEKQNITNLFGVVCQTQFPSSKNSDDITVDTVSNIIDKLTSSHNDLDNIIESPIMSEDDCNDNSHISSDNETDDEIIEISSDDSNDPDELKKLKCQLRVANNTIRHRKRNINKCDKMRSKVREDFADKFSRIKEQETLERISIERLKRLKSQFEIDRKIFQKIKDDIEKEVIDEDEVSPLFMEKYQFFQDALEITDLDNEEVFELYFTEFIQKNPQSSIKSVHDSMFS